MAKEDILLRVEMGKLEIEPSRGIKNIKIINLKQQKKLSTTKNVHQSYKCSCLSYKKNKNLTICKKKHKILKEPVLKLSQCYSRNEYQSFIKDNNQTSLTPNNNIDSLSVHALVDNCNQLSISSENHNRNTSIVEKTNDATEWWRGHISQDKQLKDYYSEKGQSSSCSQEALNPPCDVTIDELASYFETLVHIPKKMSSMAEMMYI